MQAALPEYRGRLTAHGFPAIELMVTLAILAVLASLAAPSFTPLVERWRVSLAVEALQSTLHYARSEAIRRGGNVFIQKLPQGTNGCSLAAIQAEWGCGWVVFVDADGNRKWDAGEEIRRVEASANINVMRSRSTAFISVDRRDRWTVSRPWALRSRPNLQAPHLRQRKASAWPLAAASEWWIGRACGAHTDAYLSVRCTGPKRVFLPPASHSSKDDLHSSGL